MARKVKQIDNAYTRDRRIQLKVSKVVRKRLMVFGGFLLAILLFLSILLIVQMNQNRELKTAYQTKTEELKKLKDREMALKEELKQLNSKEYITKVARSEYFLSNDGEIIFKLPEEDTEK
ncbi:septum formation initiator family protein [Macrococcus hajekii]|uniref:Septum formation initiator family protein n=1 Tax=Macrococcus hajekii TaxID=198482 RepID=A0A4R6BHP4_9STAP|nr:septum formation initiator family protein [Macrococcus hajekii]TDM01033.1 septum formation initiator family protein [Macrococcus hajekii]GGB12913.1 cell division protein DIVIC [Macrococcus hajekii]